MLDERLGVMMWGRSRESTESDPIQVVRIVAMMGDALIFLAFAFIGRTSHREADAGAITGLLGTALPFLAGWFASAVAFGGYASDTLSTVRIATTRTLRVWVIGCAIALAIRSVLEHRIVPLTFAAIAFTFNLMLLATWHGCLAAISRRWRRAV